MVHVELMNKGIQEKYSKNIRDTQIAIFKDPGKQE